MKTNIPEDVHLLEYMDKVDELYEKMPKDKRTLDYKTWKKEYNELITKVNGWAKEKIFKKQ